MKLKTIVSALGIAIATMAVVIFCITTLPWLVLALGISSMPAPPSPQITYGEFPFRLEYKIDGETIIVEDTVICEYDGIGSNEANGKYRKWKKILANSGEQNVLLLDDGFRQVYCYVGDAEYYMGDEKYPEPIPLTPRLYLVGQSIPRSPAMSEVSMQDQITATFNIELVSWEFSDPIENEFISE